MRKLDDTLSIGELAERAGVGLDTLRYYERRGLLAKPPRTASGYRCFSPESVHRVQFIKHAQALGFTLKEVEELLALRVDPNTTCMHVKQRAEEKVADIERKIQQLKAFKKALSRLATACTGKGPASQCSLLDAIESETFSETKS